MKNFFFVLCSLLLLHTNNLYASEAGMPQLNPEFWAAQIFWLVLIFLSLYVIIWKIFLPKIIYNIETRKSKTANDLHEAQKLKEKAEQKLNDYKKIIENAKNDAKKIIEDNQKKLVKEVCGSIEKEDAGYDINSYKDAPAGIRIWGGATVESEDIEKLLPWIEWAFFETLERYK
jgi:hypothetical protein